MAIYVNFEALEEASSALQGQKAKIESELHELESIVAGTTQNDWKGPDADKFVATTKEKISRISEQYTSLLTQIKNEIDENNRKFQEVQQQNINMMGE